MGRLVEYYHYMASTDEVVDYTHIDVDNYKSQKKYLKVSRKEDEKILREGLEKKKRRTS